MVMSKGGAMIRTHSRFVIVGVGSRAEVERRESVKDSVLKAAARRATRILGRLCVCQRVPTRGASRAASQRIETSDLM